MYFKHKNFTGKRQYECTQIAFCIAETSPGDAWENCSKDELYKYVDNNRMIQLFIQGNIRYFGWL